MNKKDKMIKDLEILIGLMLIVMIIMCVMLIKYAVKSKNCQINNTNNISVKNV